MREEYCEACETLKDDAYTFATKGVTTAVANRLKNDNGFSSTSSVDTDCEALNIGNDCLIGGQEDVLENYDVCDIKVWLKESWANLHTMLKAIIAAICGLWTKVHCILSGLQTLLGQLTKEDNFAAETHYAIALGVSTGTSVRKYREQYIIPTITDTYAQGRHYDRDTIIVESNSTNAHGYYYTTLTGPGDQIVFPSDGVAICGCCTYSSAAALDGSIRLSYQVVFYTDMDDLDGAWEYNGSSWDNIYLDTRGIHIGLPQFTSSALGTGAYATSASSTIKVKKGSALRIFLHPSSSANSYDPSWTPSQEGEKRPSDTVQPGTVTLHQVWCTFVPNFSSALNVDPTIFNSCGE